MNYNSVVGEICKLGTCMQLVQLVQARETQQTATSGRLKIEEEDQFWKFVQFAQIPLCTVVKQSEIAFPFSALGKFMNYSKLHSSYCIF